MPKPRMEISHITCQEEVQDTTNSRKRDLYSFLGLAGVSTVKKVEQ
jgi:hypothetical protein